MALTDLNSTSAHTRINLKVEQVARQKLAPPGLLRCLVFSWSERRTRVLRQAAEAEAWDAIACRDCAQFLRNVFEQRVPLTLVDLPEQSAAHFEEMREAATRAKEASKSLLVISVAKGSASDEIWARQLGIWSYLPEMSQQEGWETVFRDARQALARQASSYLESNGQTQMRSVLG